MTSSDFTKYILKGTDSTTITLLSVKPTANLVSCKVVCSEKGEGQEGGKRHKAMLSKLAASII